MRIFVFMLMFVGVLVGVSQAEIIVFEAEDSAVYTTPGGWEDGVAEGASEGVFITAINDGTTHNTEYDRYYVLNIPAGTYDLHIRLSMSTDGGRAVNDSFYCSNGSFASDAAMFQQNNTGATGLDGVSGENGSFAWYDIGTTDFVWAGGEATFKLSTREDGIDIDAIAFVADGDTVSDTILNEAPRTGGAARGQAVNPQPDGSEDVDFETTTALTWEAPPIQTDDPNDPNLASIDGYTVWFGTEPNVIENQEYYVTAPSTTLLLNGVGGNPAPLAPGTTYSWRVNVDANWDSSEFDSPVVGAVWKFTTKLDDYPPEIEGAPDQILSAMEFLPVILSADVNDLGEGTGTYGDLVSAAWTVTPAEKVVSLDPGGDLYTPTAELIVTEAGTYEATLTVKDSGYTVEHNVTITVGADACDAAQKRDGFAFNDFDLNTDCQVTLLDFAEFAGQWLVDKAITGQVNE